MTTVVQFEFKSLQSQDGWCLPGIRKNLWVREPSPEQGSHPHAGNRASSLFSVSVSQSVKRRGSTSWLIRSFPRPISGMTFP